jgi:2-dehydro-3-deoxyphosphogluconate aldolase / (4S)-4-hydroxy-2-oxoglutarate aldolase
MGAVGLMMNKQRVIERMCQSGILPVFRTADVRHLVSASRAYYDAGIGCVEYTMTMPGALELIKKCAAALPKDFLLGMGTAMDGRMVDAAVEAGASFIASPGFSAEMVEACKRRGVASVVGAITPTEIMEALRAGADVIKVFPATSVGTIFFSEMLGPFPGLCLMAAGGMSLENLGDYVRAGAQVVTFSANNLDAAAYASGDAAAITRAARKWVDTVAAARQAK